MRAVGLSALMVLASCAPNPAFYQGFAIGTSISLTLPDGPQPRLWEAIQEQLRWLDDTMTIWDRQVPSELMQLNAMAGDRRGYEPSAELREVIRLGLEVGRASEGALDITIGPVVKAWGVASDAPRVPDNQELRAALDRVGLQQVQMEGNRVVLLTPGMILDLGAVAKGWMGQRIVEFLRREGVNRAILDLGGNIALLGEKADGSPWRVGIQDPFRARGTYFGILSTGETHVVTSGVYERYFDVGGVRYHHIFDPLSGYPVENELASVTVVHRDGGLADALSTAVFVLGMEKGARLGQRYGAGLILVTRDRRVWVSPEVRDRFQLTAADFEVLENPLP